MVDAFEEPRHTANELYRHSSGISDEQAAAVRALLRQMVPESFWVQVELLRFLLLDRSSVSSSGSLNSSEQVGVDGLAFLRDRQAEEPAADSREALTSALRSRMVCAELPSENKSLLPALLSNSLELLQPQFSVDLQHICDIQRRNIHQAQTNVSLDRAPSTTATWLLALAPARPLVTETMRSSSQAHSITQTKHRLLHRAAFAARSA